MSDTDDALALYLREAASHDLLTQAEEQALGALIRAGREAQTLLASGPAHPAAALLTHVIADGAAAEKTLMAFNQRLIIPIARRFAFKMPLLDLIQEGNLGLQRAVAKYDATRGHKFSTYATWWIRQAVQRALAEAGDVRLPVYVMERATRLRGAAAAFEQREGREPTPQELAAETGLSVQSIERTLTAFAPARRLDAAIGDEDDRTLADVLADNHPDTLTADETVAQRALREQLDGALDTLDAREARILRLRYGLVDGRAQTLEEVGQKFGLTRERIRQIEQEALRKLRHPSRARKLRAFREGKRA